MATAQEEPVRAVRLYPWAYAARTSIHDSRPQNEKAEADRDFAILKEKLDEETYQKAYARMQKGNLLTFSRQLRML